MTKTSLLHSIGRQAIPAGAAALALMTGSCRLPSRETWNLVQQRGLFPVLLAPNPEPAAPSPSGKEEATAPPTSVAISTDPAPLKVQAVQQPEIAKIPFATPVPGSPGYVFSPHTPGRKLVDVRNYAAGAEVRCPYTMLPFNVPDLSASPPPAPQLRPQRSVAEVASTGANPLPVLPRNNPPAPATSPAPTPDADIPYGSRVPGRVGFVFSPFADKNQLVDVAGIAPGVEVKCPYSGKLFRVPEPLPEEMTPAPANIVPESPPAVNPAPAPSPAPSPSSAAPQTPTAAWSDKEKNLVQSPFGTAGQWIDVSGRAPGSRMQCPFTNKEFIIPAP
jgi:hypothetical protein